MLWSWPALCCAKVEEFQAKMLINRHQKNMNYFKVETGQVLFWGCKGHFRKRGPGSWKSPRGTALSHGRGRSVEEARPHAGMQFVLPVKLRGVLEHPLTANHKFFGKKKKKFNIIVDFPTLKLKNTGYMFLDVFGEKKADKLKKHIQTLHLKCSQAIHDANQKDLTVFFFKHKHFCTYKIFSQLTYKNTSIIHY